AVGRVDSVVFVYDVRSREVVRRFKSFPEGLTIHAVAFSPDGSMIAVAAIAGLVHRHLPDGTIENVSPRNRVRVFKTQDGSQVAAYAQPLDSAWELAWSPDGRFIAFVMGARTLHLWDPFASEQSQRTVELSRRPEADSLGFSPDGRRLAVSVDTKVRI